MNPQTWLFEPYRRIGQMIVFYFLAAPWPFKPTIQDYQNWLGQLPQESRKFYSGLGFQACQAVNAFRRYWLEERGYRLKDYLRMHLIPQEYTMYKQMERYGSRYPIYEDSTAPQRADFYTLT